MLSSPSLSKLQNEGQIRSQETNGAQLSSSDGLGGGDDEKSVQNDKDVEQPRQQSRHTSVPGTSKAPRLKPHSTRSSLTRVRDGDDSEKASGDRSSGSEEDMKYEVDWDGDDDPQSPRSLSSARKWLITLILSLGSMCVTCTSSLYTMTYKQIDQEFATSRFVSTFGLSLFVFGLGLSPMVLGPLSEFYGRRPIYIGAFVFFTIWLVPCALARNIQTMLVARFFNGLSGSAFLSVAGGTVGDMFIPKYLQAPMMVYTASPMLGPSLGPVIGGFVNSYLDWRWSFYILLIWSGLMLAAVVLFVPETYSPVVSCFSSTKGCNTLTGIIHSFSVTKLAGCGSRQATRGIKRQLKSWIAASPEPFSNHFTARFSCSLWIQCA
jgi:multidrug resistance protein